MEKITKTKMKTHWVILCKSASVDQQSNQLSIFSIIEDININQSQNPITAFSKIVDLENKTSIKFDHNIVVLFERNIATNNMGFDPLMKIEIFDPKKEKLIETEVPIKFEEGKIKVRSIISLDSFIVKNSGKYEYIISTKNFPSDQFENKASATVQVKIYE